MKASWKILAPASPGPSFPKPRRQGHVSAGVPTRERDRAHRPLPAWGQAQAAFPLLFPVVTHSYVR